MCEADSLLERKSRRIFHRVQRKEEDYFALGVPERKCEPRLHYPVVAVRAYRRALSSSHTHLKMLWQVQAAETTVEQKITSSKISLGNAWGSLCSLSNRRDMAVSTAKASRSILSYSGAGWQEADAVPVNMMSAYRCQSTLSFFTSLLQDPENFF